MRRFIVGILAVIGAMSLLVFFTIFWSFHRMAPPSLPLLAAGDSFVLTLTIGEDTLPEHPRKSGVISLIEGNSPSVYSIVQGINYAAKDERVKGIFLTLEGNALKVGTTQEIRDALKAFKATGKFIYAYAPTFGELSNGTINYYLAAVATKIWMMPVGALNFTGMIAEVPFAKQALEDFKIRPQVGRREEYKGMIESITESDFSPPYKENMQRLLDILTTQIVTDVAADRNLEVAEVRKILDTSPYTPSHAVAARMIDQVGYKDQAKEDIEKRLGQKPIYYSFDSYTQTLPPSSGEKIAIIYASGTISKGKSVRNPLLDDAIMDASEIVKSIQEASENKDIKAIILRIDSGGGNPIASDLIGREMERAKLKKPVIVSMSNYAASGGYWIACNAHKIVAQPATITGSIGFFAGKIVTQGFWEHYGIHWGEIHNGNNARIWSSSQEYSENERQKFNEYLDQIYDIFQEKVAHGRKLAPEKVRQLAKGQVWTGAEAKENGLIDALGGLDKAVETAKKEMGLAIHAPVTLVHLPAPKGVIDLIFNRPWNNESRILSPSLRMVLQRFGMLFAPPQIELKVDELAP